MSRTSKIKDSTDNAYEPPTEKQRPEMDGRNFGAVIAGEYLLSAMRYGLNVKPSKDIQRVKEMGAIGRPQKWDY